MSGDPPPSHGEIASPRTADLVLLPKVDLLHHLPAFDVAALEDALARVMPEPRFIPVSATTGTGLRDWMTWLESRLRSDGPTRETS